MASDQDEPGRTSTSDPEGDASRKRGGSLIYIILGLLAAAIGVAIAIWSTRGDETSEVPDANKAGSAAARPEKAPDGGAGSASDAQLTEAFEAATGHRASFTGRDGEDVVTTAPLRIVRLPFGSALLTTQEIKDGCHACTGALGIYYLREESGKTIVAGRWPRAIEGWGWGAAPTDWSITDKFTEFPAIFASGGGGGQGVSVEGFTLTELRPTGPVTSEVIRTSYSDAGQVEKGVACEVRGKVTNIRKDRGFDVIVSGSIRGVDHYIKKEGKFVPTSKIDWDMPCSSGEE
jgi:hypothetical protein